MAIYTISCALSGRSPGKRKSAGTSGTGPSPAPNANPHRCRRKRCSCAYHGGVPARTCPAHAKRSQHLLIFPGEGHSLGKNPLHGEIKVREELKWLEKYCPAPPSARSTTPARPTLQIFPRGRFRRRRHDTLISKLTGQAPFQVSE